MDKILIADDEAEIRSLLKLYLENEGYAVAEAGDGKEALKVLAGGDVSLCLLDVMMPEMDGFHVLKELRKNNNIPVIIISAKDTAFCSLSYAGFNRRDILLRYSSANY